VDGGPVADAVKFRCDSVGVARADRTHYRHDGITDWQARTGDHLMEKDSMANKLKGKANQAAGAAREKLGDVSGNEQMERRGREQHAKGDAQEALGKAQDQANRAKKQAKDAVQSVADKMKDVVDR